MNLTKEITIKTFIILTLFFISCGDAVKPEDITFAIPQNIVQEEIGSFSADNYGYIIYDIDQSKVVKAHNSRKVFIPASVTKIFTAFYALETFSEKERLKTALYYSGKISGDTLKGDIYLKGSGDPSLSIPDLVKLAMEIKKKGIKSIDGSFYFDESLFEPRETITGNMSPDARYNTGISPLSLNRNNVFAVQKKDSEGWVTGYSLLPSLPVNSTRLYNDRTATAAIRYMGSGDVETWGFSDRRAVPKQTLPVKKPGPFTAWTFRLICAIHGIKLPEPAAGTVPDKARVLVSHESDRLSTIARDILHSSNNPSAELAAILSVIKNGGESDGSMEQVENFFSSRFTGLNWDGFRLVNGSGLNSDGRISPEQTAALLIYADMKKYHGMDLEYYLPLAGWEGTMQNRLDSPESAFRVYAKTGSIFYASGLAGFFYSNSGKKYIFSIFISDINRRTALDNNPNRLSHETAEAVSWSNRAMKTIDEFLIKQIKEL